LAILKGQEGGMPCKRAELCQLVFVVNDGVAAVTLALVCFKNQVVMVSRLRWDAALFDVRPQSLNRGD
jgi:hypothetical protein